MLWGRSVLGRWLLLSLLNFLLFLEPLSAQPVTPPIPDDVNRQSERLQERAREEQRRRVEELEERQRTAPSGQDVAVPDEKVAPQGECITVTKAIIKGVTLYPEGYFSDSLKPVVGRCVFITDIDTILRTITNKYVEDGYVTSRALVAPQDLDHGEIEIIVIEGSLSEIKVDEQDFSQSELGAAFPGLKGKTLNLRDIEQGIDQMLRLPSFDPSIDIEPAKTPGASNLLVKRKKAARFIRPSLSLNNDGQRSTGRLQSTMAVDADNLVGLLDYWSLYFSRDLGTNPSGSTQAVGGFISIPRGYWTVSLAGGYSEYDSVIAGNGQSFSSDGRTANGSATLERLFFRDSNSKLSASVGLGLFDTVNRIQGIRLSTSSYRLVTASAELRLQQRLQKGLFSAAVGFTQGVDILGADTVDTGLGGPGTKFSKITGNFSYREPFKLLGGSFQYSLTARGQFALNPIFPAQRFSVGGSSTVRGFRDDGNSGRTGAIVRQQISVALGEPIKSLGPVFSPRFSAYAAYDAGGIAARKDNPFERGFLNSASAGLQMSARHIQADVGLSIPISSPSFVQKRDVELGTNIRLSF